MLSLVDEIKKIIPKEFNQNNVEAFLAKAEEYAEDSEFTQDSGNAKEFAQIVDNIRGQYDAQIKGLPELEKRLKMLSIKLHWMYGLSLDTNLKSDLVSLNLVKAIRVKIDVLSGFVKWLDFYESGAEVDDKRRSDMMYLLSNNSEWIGNNKIATANGTLVPTVQNWIKDFLISLPRNSELPGSFDKVNYFTNNSNAQKLTAGEKEILSKIIDIYRYLKNPNEKITSFSASVNQYTVPNLEVPRTPPPVPRPVVPKSEPVQIPVVKPPSPVQPNFVLSGAGHPLPEGEGKFEEKQMTAFEKRLAEVSRSPSVSEARPDFSGAAVPPPAAHGADLEALKHRMEQSQVKKPGTTLTPQEIKREVSTPELPAYVSKPIVPAAPVVPKAIAPIPPTKAVTTPAPRPSSMGEARPGFTGAAKPVAPVPKPSVPTRPVSSFESALNDIKNMDDLKRIELSHLRRGPVDQQSQRLKTKIIDLAHSNSVMPYYALTAFEKSPLFRSYMAHGQALFAGQQTNGELTKEEFEAIADLRKEIQRL